MRQQFDCIIVGGGIIGLTTTLALAQNNFKVALVEANPLNFEYDSKEFSLRVSAITRSSENIFKNLQIWPMIVAERVSRYNKIRVWEEPGDGIIEFAADKISELNLGHIIENRVIQKSLFSKIASNSNVTIFNPARCLDLYHLEENLIVQLDISEEISAKLIIGADGANSWVRNRSQIELIEKGYNQNAIVATIKTELPHLDTARQRFLKDGILAFLPLSEPHTHSIVWSVETNKSEVLMTLSDEEFELQLETAFASILGKITMLSKRASFPLYMRHAKNYVKPRVALIGDAAHTIHPLAGQGVNLGLLDAACLVNILLKTRAAGRDIGLFQHLRKYELARKSDNQMMILAMAGFKNLFGKENSAVIWARNLGLNLTDKAEPVKNLFMKKAMGLIGDIPPLGIYPK